LSANARANSGVIDQSGGRRPEHIIAWANSAARWAGDALADFSHTGS
jgi:hypothetical protein